VRDNSIGLPHLEVNQATLIAVEVAKGNRSVATHHLLDGASSLPANLFVPITAIIRARASGPAVKLTSLVEARAVIVGATSTIAGAASRFATGAFEPVSAAEPTEGHTEITTADILRQVTAQSPGERLECMIRNSRSGRTKLDLDGKYRDPSGDPGIEILGFEQFLHLGVDLRGEPSGLRILTSR
jgi:hypothetical protein